MDRTVTMGRPEGGAREVEALIRAKSGLPAGRRRAWNGRAEGASTCTAGEKTGGSIEGGTMSGSHMHLGRIVGRVAVAVAALATGSLAFLSAAVILNPGTAGASVGCGMSLGTPQVEGAAGSFAFVVQTIPAVAGQVCNARIS